ncbi:MAG: hypothetical protein GXP34_10665 [Actinobacteria bacterium]|nr:hypothetical protein [Actinomycetota bacterium]
MKSRHLRLVVLLVVVFLVGAACTPTDSTKPVPAMTAALSVELQARTFMRACQDVICAGAPILAPDTTEQAVRDAIRGFTDEVQYVDMSKLGDLTGPDGRFDGGAILIGVGTVHSTERDDVVGVDVSLLRGFNQFRGRTYLFLWDGTEWVDTSPDAVDVTVTSSVS